MTDVHLDRIATALERLADAEEARQRVLDRTESLLEDMMGHRRPKQRPSVLPMHRDSDA